VYERSFENARVADRQSRTSKIADSRHTRQCLDRTADEVRTLVRGFGMGDSVYASSFKDDLYCFRARIKFAQPQNTDAVCVRLLRWNQHALLGIDPQSGAVLEWWVEMQ
jgi:hypothetical protein